MKTLLPLLLLLLLLLLSIELEDVKVMLPGFVWRVSGDVTNYCNVFGLGVEVGTSNVSNMKQDCNVRYVHVITYCVCPEVLPNSWLLFLVAVWGGGELK